MKISFISSRKKHNIISAYLIPSKYAAKHSYDNDLPPVITIFDNEMMTCLTLLVN